MSRGLEGAADPGWPPRKAGFKGISAGLRPAPFLASPTFPRSPLSRNQVRLLLASSPHPHPAPPPTFQLSSRAGPWKPFPYPNLCSAPAPGTLPWKPKVSCCAGWVHSPGSLSHAVEFVPSWTLQPRSPAGTGHLSASCPEEPWRPGLGHRPSAQSPLVDRGLDWASAFPSYCPLAPAGALWGPFLIYCFYSLFLCVHCREV